MPQKSFSDPKCGHFYTDEEQAVQFVHTQKQWNASLSLNFRKQIITF
jgi:hypothetical protein